ncbi:MAG: hypothetical protein MI923_00370, partial [Phycisphaerales bacterium]|nr:hypothetical protein [Phycisphaerales bacterium]
MHDDHGNENGVTTQQSGISIGDTNVQICATAGDSHIHRPSFYRSSWHKMIRITLELADQANGDTLRGKA